MNYQRFGLIGSLALVLTACGGNDSTPGNMATSSSMPMSSVMASSSMASMTELSFSVSVTNLTAAQPLSPLAYALHHASFKPFTIGMPASSGVEMLAESGETVDYLAEANADEAVIMANTASGMTMPGEYKTFTFSAMVPSGEESDVYFSVISMLVNTNDALTGLNSIAVNQLAIGQSWTFDALSYDAGTEKNTELAASIPGPAAGGEGFNAARDDTSDQVTMHPGVITSDDGKTESVLTQLHRWDNPVARITITRLAP